MNVRVVLFGLLRQKAGFERGDVELEQGATVADLLARLGLPDRVDVWALVNGRRASRDTALSDGAEVQFFQPVGGG
ncbi:MAG: MoaD/ThiS family protein [Deltaproteobacteria bacterium]|nr:MAG: MoaD/ThiS family protein [Deltaproteobacteria bacterium]